MSLAPGGSSAITARRYRAPAWCFYKSLAARPAYTAPPPAPSFAPEKVRHSKDGTSIQTYLFEDAAALLKELPISSTTLRVKILRDTNGSFSAEIYGYSPAREFGPAVQRMVEENQRQHGQKTLGAPLSEGSLARIVEKFSKLDARGDEEQAASAWGRAGLAVITCLDLRDTYLLGAVVTTKTNHQVNIKVTGFIVPVKNRRTSSFAEQIAEEIWYLLPSDRRLNKDEFEYYCLKAIALDELPEHFKPTNLLTVFATAADFSAEVTSLSAVGKGNKGDSSAIGHEPIADDNLRRYTYFDTNTPARQHNSGRRPTGNSRPASTTLPSYLNSSPPQHQPIATPPQAQTSILAKHLAVDVATQAESIARFGSTNLSRFDKSQKRTWTDAELEEDNRPSTKKPQSSTDAGKSTKTPRPNRRSGDEARPPRTPDPDNSSSSSDLPNTPKPKRRPRVLKRIPTRDEIHAAWISANMTQYTVPQLRGYLRQEGLFSGLNSTSTRNELMVRVQVVEEPERRYPGEGRR